MRYQTKLVLAGASLVLLVLLALNVYRRIEDGRNVAKLLNPENPQAGPVLPPDAKVGVVIKGHRVSVATRKADGTTSVKTRYVPPEGGAAVLVQKNGSTAVRVQR